MLQEYLLNTPAKYWITIFGYHLHKSFFGVIFLLLGIIIFSINKKSQSRFKKLGIILASFGLILVILSILGHIYTDNHPYFKLWDKMY